MAQAGGVYRETGGEGGEDPAWVGADGRKQEAAPLPAAFLTPSGCSGRRLCPKCSFLAQEETAGWGVGREASRVRTGSGQAEAPPSSLLQGGTITQAALRKGPPPPCAPSPAPVAVGDISPGGMEGGIGRRPS